MMKMFRFKFILVLIFCVTGDLVIAEMLIKDFGTRGHTFKIQEHSLLEVIAKRVKDAEKSGKLSQLQEQFKEKVKASIINPVPVANITKTVTPRTFYFDPSYTATHDFNDNDGNLIVKKGTIIDPFDYVAWGEPLIFIDGTDLAQLAWSNSQSGKIVLINGSPVLLQEKYRREFYFDQAGVLSRKFNIEHVPAIVSQENRQLKIEEIVL